MLLLTRYRAATGGDSSFVIKETRFRNKLEWSLVTTRPIAAGTCLGFYSGEFRPSGGDSLYAASLLTSVDIHPFADEGRITEWDRRRRPFANMNEPNEDDIASCCMLLRDFAASEIEGVENIPDYARALFFRGLACFTCRDLGPNEPLTWHYGRAYEPHRVDREYKAGAPCTADEMEQVPIDAVFRAFPKIPWRVVHPVLTPLKSLRFKPAPTKKKKRDDDDDTSSSGSGHVPKYTPRVEDREDRNERRRLARERQLS